MIFSARWFQFNASRYRIFGQHIKRCIQRVTARSARENEPHISRRWFWRENCGHSPQFWFSSSAIQSTKGICIFSTRQFPPLPPPSPLYTRIRRAPSATSSIMRRIIRRDVSRANNIRSCGREILRQDIILAWFFPFQLFNVRFP